MSRIAIKITGAQGQGVNSVGEICAKGLKRAGYCIFGYREYMSVIKGGHSSYQLDVSNEEVRSTHELVDILVCFNHHGLELNVEEVRDGGVIIHQSPDWKWSTKQSAELKKKKIITIVLPTEEILRKLRAKPILGNMLITSVVWALLGQSADALRKLASEQFASKKDLLELNMQCIDEGFAFTKKQAADVRVELPEHDDIWKDRMLLTGSEAMGLGAIHAGVRFYAGYPMTPSSPLLKFIADMQNKTGMVVKQAEDEITAAQMASGAMFMGTRALTATSGGGFDLMSETISLNAIIENPVVFVLAQRPGPATGLPTWTAQGDLLMAVSTAHGEFPRCVLSVSDAADCFELMPMAFNIAENFQIPVIVLTDKQIAEALYTQEKFDQSQTTFERGFLITEKKELAKLKATDRYDPEAEYGISKRWLPGAKAATYVAQGDEHNADGSVDETPENAKAQMEKRMKKGAVLAEATPEAMLYESDIGHRTSDKGNSEPKLDLLIVGWGSTKGPILDVMESLSRSPKSSVRSPRIGYLHYTYLWPLKTEKLQKLAKKAKHVVLIEGNYQGQLGQLIRQDCGLNLERKILKYDGRPFFYDELLEAVSFQLSASGKRFSSFTKS
ncbi:2-oxoacid:acceptor oxidoreductase subunit alpha [Candidatus Peregrinibacteria bacterium]|nr:2-oxoacid:acceptor oxidoreductase subunit alpha [Candidatus Peregrinibacteria bacterium]